MRLTILRVDMDKAVIVLFHDDLIVYLLHDGSGAIFDCLLVVLT